MCVTGVLSDSYVKVVWNETIPAGTYFIIANYRGAQKVIGEFKIPPGGHKGRIFVSVDAEGSFFVAGNSGAMDTDGTVGLFTRPNPTADLSYEAGTTTMLGQAGSRVSCVSGPRREGAARQ